MEFIAYDHALTDAERRGVEAYLMEKWGIARDAKAETPVYRTGLSTNVTLTVGNSAALDLPGMAQKVAKVSVTGAAAITNGAFAAEALEVVTAEDKPQLLLSGAFDATTTALTFTGKPGPDKFLKTQGVLTYPFASVTGTAKEIRYSAHSAGILSGLMLLFR